MNTAPTPGQPTDASRAAFEKHWIATRGYKKGTRELRVSDVDAAGYALPSTQRHWWTWQAAARAAPKSVQAQPIRLASDRERRIYVAGPMTGYPDWNFPAFHAAAAKLRAEGWHVENPADHGLVDGAEWSDYLLHDIGKLASCSAIYLLAGWSKSRGAQLEFHIALTTGLHVMLADDAEAV